ncbi:MAG: VOC family protein [Caldilineaceae bacterium]|nr:VOC family protein [Caldilineaceae bacterium]
MNARLQHVALPRPPETEEAALAFYGGLLGLRKITPPRSLQSLGVLWFGIGDGSELHSFVEGPMGQDHSGRHFCLAVEDVEELRDRLEAAGVTVVGDVPIPDRPRYFIRDPFGNLIELTTIDTGA